MEKIPSTSLDLTEEKINKLKSIFPEALTDGKIDFDKLRLVLGDELEEKIEKYQFTWNGKSQTIRFAQSPSTGTLRPCKEDSVDWDTTENLYIEGDNLEVLKILQKTYHSKIKMIYIDPPYNTGNDFVYKDNFRDNIANYKLQTNQQLKANPETNGRYHSDWLNMMYSRLLIAKNLLSDDGIILISIDDKEHDNLKKVCDELFGETNYVANFIWKSKSGGANDTNHIAVDTEYILCYAKDKSMCRFGLDKEAKVTTLYNLEDENGRYSLDRLDKQSLGYNPTLDFPIIGPDGKEYTVEHKNPKVKVARWRWGKDTVEERYNELVFKYPYVYTKNYEKSGSIPRNLLVEQRFGRSRTGKTEVKSIFNGINYFDFPKPLGLITYFIDIVSEKNSIILDFFSGSATTAHAVMKLNAEDGGNRKFIMVQLPELTGESSEAYKAGYKNICEIGKERIRRAGKQIKEELDKSNTNEGLFASEENPSDKLDVGFKVFKLDSTNLIPWDGSIKNIDTIFTERDIIKEDRNDIDLIYEIMLKYGIFDMPVEIININNKSMYSIANGHTIICLYKDKDITVDDIKAIVNQKPRNVIFRETGFANDNDKINATYTLKKSGVEEVKCI